jgi:uncharacterized protein (TIGR02265 family)
MADKRVVFGNTAHGLFQVALKGKLSPGALEQLRAAGLDVDREVAVAYPFAQWKRLLEIAALDFSPSVGRDEAYRRLGEQLVLGLVETVPGRAMMAMGRLMGPAKTLARMNRNFRNSDNFVQGRLTELGPGHFEFWLNETLGQPTFYQGILLASVAVAGAREPRVDIVSVEEPACTYHIHWKA